MKIKAKTGATHYLDWKNLTEAKFREILFYKYQILITYNIFVTIKLQLNDLIPNVTKNKVETYGNCEISFTSLYEQL